MKKKILSSKAPSPIGPYSQAVVKNNTLYASGQIAIDPSSGQLKVNDLKTEVTIIFSNISAVLYEANFTANDIVKVSVFLKNMDDFQEVNIWYAEFFDRVEIYPARETVEVSRLPKNVNVEISFIAVK